MRLVGSYTLGPLLGRGGTGEVYAAQGPTGMPVAVKLLRPELALDAAMIDAFVGEATRTRDIVHPNIVRVLDFGTEAATGRCYLVMERLAGESLAARIAREGALSEATVRSLGAAIADGMAAAHERGIVHRDLKPGNVMLDGDRPTVIDFGVAKSLGAGSAVVTARRVGTLVYMAPEQLAQGLITPAVDIWALGAILYEAVTGEPPFRNFAEGRLPQLVESPPSPATRAQVSAALSKLILQCLDREPGRRPSSMAELADRLASVDAGERVTVDAGPIDAAIDSSPTVVTMPAPPRHRRWMWITAGGGLVAAIAIGGVAMSSSSKPVASLVDRSPPTSPIGPIPLDASPTSVVEEAPPPQQLSQPPPKPKPKPKPPATRKRTKPVKRATSPTPSPSPTREGLD